MKVGIVTIIDYRNYGNRLQNFALQKIMESKGIDAVTILNDFYKDYKYNDKSITNSFMHCVKVLIWNIWSKFTKNSHKLNYVGKSDDLLKKRIYNNISFSKKYINETNYLVRGGITHTKKWKGFDYLIVGSDQVWNPKMNFATDFFFLQRVAPEKRVAFSASCGVDRIPKQYEEQWKRYLSGMKSVSVREKSAAKYIESVCDRKVEVLLDPTMLVEREVWNEIISPIKKKSGRYLLTYILGDDETNAFINELSLKTGLQVISLNDRREKEWFVIAADEFVSLIANAELVITDSFHACVFSILYEREFFVIHRKGDIEDIFSRIDNLLKLFNLEDRIIDKMSVEGLNAYPLSHQNIEDILERERKRAENFLDKVLSEKIKE